MQRALAIAGLVVAGLIALLFAVDLIAGIPFGGKSMLMDVGTIVAALVLGYMSWNTLREAA
jgi:hypothetical protein